MAAEEIGSVVARTLGRVGAAATRTTSVHRGAARMMPSACVASVDPTASVARGNRPRSLSSSSATSGPHMVGDALPTVVGAVPFPAPHFAGGSMAGLRVALTEEDAASEAGAQAAAVGDSKVEEPELATAVPTHPFKMAAYSVPKHSQRELGKLFGVDKAVTSSMGVITVALRANNNMAVWSSELVEERDVLLDEFHQLARRCVSNLQAAGHWADHVDPNSGEPQLSRTSTGLFPETDDRLRFFGFKIHDFGCCKAVAHPDWGTNVFVGVIFTDAPKEIISHLASVVAASSLPVASGVGSIGEARHEEVASVAK